MKKLILFTAAVLLLAGCQGVLKTATFSDEQVMPLAEGRADSLTMSIILDYPVKGADEEVLGKITRSILYAAFDLEEEEPGTVEEAALRYEDDLKDEYFSDNEELLGGAEPEGMLSWEDRINGYFSGRYHQFVSYMIEYSNFRGGAHGSNSMFPLVFDTRTGDVVPEEAFFADGYVAPVAELIRARLPEALDNNEEDLAAVFGADLMGPNGNYELTSGGVTWYYQSFDIAPSYLGVISVFVPWKELKPYIRK